MAEATLRAYLKDIDDLIEREQLDEAIAHCRHILQLYPKHLDTYRLLGKAYLEAKRFGDAADIFQRVLSAVPDDFVAHVGMSIVREDEGNTDAAIWHMERAFETTPANPAIQQELRRLIGRRDGIEPHKVRLTRGALARMYAHGELYPQAVAELRAALQEDPERADLQVVLAEMYWRTGQRAEAVEVANKIIEKLPYCREANRILAAAYQSSGRTEEAATHHRRLATLDPYAAFIETPMSDPQAVDPGSVRLDRLEWAPGQAMPLGQPEWASSLSADLRGEAPAQPVAGPVPSWLEEATAAAPAAAPTPPPPPTPQPAAPPPTPPSGTDIPSWMRQAGWSESTGAAVEGAVGFTDDEISSLETGAPPLEETGDLAPGEIPEWLQAVAPKQPMSEEPLPEAWEAQLSAPSGGGGQAPPWLGEAEASLEPAPEVPWEPPAAEEQPAAIEPGAGLPEDWGAPPVEAAGLPSEAELESQALPSWLEEPSPGATDTIITWLGDRAARDTGDLAMPSWMDESARGGETPAPAEEAPVLSFPEGMPEEALPPEPEPATTQLPGWLAGVADAAAQQEPLPEEDRARFRERGEAAPAPEGEAWAGGGGEPEEETPLAEREAPDWLRGIVEPGAEPEKPAEPEPGPSWLAGTQLPKPRGLAPAPEPDWMRGLGEPGTEGAEMPEEVREAPGWLKSIQESREPQPKAEEEAPVWMQEQAPAAGAGMGEPEDQWPAGVGEEIPAEEMAEEPPVEEGAALAEAELPDWLSSIVPAEETAPSAEMPSEEELGGALGWLEEPSQAEATIAPEEPAAAAVELEPEPVAAAEVSGEDDVMEWLESLAAQQTTGEAAGVAEAEMLAEEEPLVQERVLPEEPAEGLEWLERLAATRGVEPAAEAPAAAAAAEAAPDWLQPYATEPAPSLEPTEAEPADSLDWLQAEEQAAPAELPSDLFEEEPAEAAAYDEDSHVPTWLLDASKAPPTVEAPGMPPSIDEMAAPAYEEPAEAFAEDTAIPDWLRASMAAPTRRAEGAGQPAAPAAEPGWIEPPTEAAPPISAEIEAAVPDWLRAPSEPPPTAPVMAEAEAEPESVWEPVPAPRAPEPHAPPPPPAPTPRLPEVAPEPVFEAAPPQLPVEAPPAPPAPLPEAPEPVLAPAVFPPAVTEPPAPPEFAPAAPLAPAPPPAAPAFPPPVFEPVPVRAAPAPEPAPPPAAPPPIAPAAPPLPVPAPAAAPPPAYPPAPTPGVSAPWEPAPAFAPGPTPQPAPAPYTPPAPPSWPPPLTPTYPAPPYPQAQPSYPVPAAPQPTYPAPAGPPPAYPPPQPPYPAPAAPQPMYPPPAAPQPSYPAPAAPQPMYPPPGAPQPTYPAPQPYWPPYPPAPPYAPQPAPEAPYPQAAYAPPPPAPVLTPAPAPAQPPKGRPAGPAPEELLERARSAMKSGDIEGALSLYAALIKKKKLLSAVVDDLKSAVERASMPPAVWQNLGDAYMKSDRLPEAIEAYRHGLESV